MIKIKKNLKERLDGIVGYGKNKVPIGHFNAFITMKHPEKAEQIAKWARGRMKMNKELGIEHQAMSVESVDSETGVVHLRGLAWTLSNFLESINTRDPMYDGTVSHDRPKPAAEEPAEEPAEQPVGEVLKLKRDELIDIIFEEVELELAKESNVPGDMSPTKPEQEDPVAAKMGKHVDALEAALRAKAKQHKAGKVPIQAVYDLRSELAKAENNLAARKKDWKNPEWHDYWNDFYASVAKEKAKANKPSWLQRAKAALTRESLPSGDLDANEAALKEAVWELFLQNSSVTKASLYKHFAPMGWLKLDVDNAIKLVVDADTSVVDTDTSTPR